MTFPVEACFRRILQDVDLVAGLSSVNFLVKAFAQRIFQGLDLVTRLWPSLSKHSRSGSSRAWAS